MELKIFKKLDEIAYKLKAIEKKIDHIENKVEESLMITRNQLVRIKNHQELSDSSILLKLLNLNIF